MDSKQVVGAGNPFLMQDYIPSTLCRLQALEWSGGGSSLSQSPSLFLESQIPSTLCLVLGGDSPVEEEEESEMGVLESLLLFVALTVSFITESNGTFSVNWENVSPDQLIFSALDDN